MTRESDGFEQFKPRISPESAMEVEYTVPFGWGQITVSKEAHLQYGLVPLVPVTPSTEQPVPLVESAVYPPTYIRIVSKDETPAKRNWSQHDAYAGLEKSPLGLNIALALGFDIETAKEQVLSDLGDAEKSLFEALGIPTEPPSELEVTQKIRQLIAHQFAGLAERSIADRVPVLLSNERANFMLARLRKLGRGALIRTLIVSGGAMLLGVSPAEATLGSAAVFTSLNSFVGYQLVKNHVASTAESTDAANNFASLLGENVARHIHETYCSHEFDLRNEHLDPDNE